jgi:hypothetical protein
VNSKGGNILYLDEVIGKTISVQAYREAISGNKKKKLICLPQVCASSHLPLKDGTKGVSSLLYLETGLLSCVVVVNACRCDNFLHNVCAAAETVDNSAHFLDRVGRQALHKLDWDWIVKQSGELERVLQPRYQHTGRWHGAEIKIARSVTDQARKIYEV